MLFIMCSVTSYYVSCHVTVVICLFIVQERRSKGKRDIKSKKNQNKIQRF